MFLFALTAIPSVQRKLAGVAADLLEERIGTHVSVKRVRVGLPGRIIVDGLQIYDHRDTLMLHVPRVAAKMNLMPLLERRIRFGNVQLFGAKAVLYHAVPDSASNWQFLTDAFSNPSDTTPTAIDLQIRSLLVRRCQVKYDRLYKPQAKGRFDANHLSLTGLSLTANLGCLTADSLNLNIKKLSGSEQSGLELSRLQFRLAANRSSLRLEDFDMQMPHTSLSLPLLTATYPGMPAKGTPPAAWLDRMEAHTQMELKAMPADLAPLFPPLGRAKGSVSLAAHISLEEGGRVNMTEIHVLDRKSVV